MRSKVEIRDEIEVIKKEIENDIDSLNFDWIAYDKGWLDALRWVLEEDDE